MIKKIVIMTVISFNILYAKYSTEIYDANRSMIIEKKTKTLIKKCENLRDIEICTYLSKKHFSLSKSYLKKSIHYISMYEKMIGKYPYKHLSIIEDKAPIGYTIPTFIFFGSMIIDKDFIQNRSLGHEILHQWFGNCVFNDTKSGNWTEGLVSYLSDYLFEEKKNRGLEYRKDILNEYPIFVNDSNEILLSQFKERYNRQTMLTGYGKGAFVFHMLRKEMGDKKFFEALKEFYKKYKFRYASYKDIADIFSKSALQWFEKKGMIDIKAKNLETFYDNGSFLIRFDLVQNKTLFEFDLLVTLITQNKKTEKIFHIKDIKTPITIKSDQRPISLILDQNIDLFRKLSSKEEIKIIANLYESKNLLVITDNKKAFTQIKKVFKKAKQKSKPDQKDIQNHDLLFLKDKEDLAKRVITIAFFKNDESVFIVKSNPFNPSRSVGFFDFDPEFLKKLPHYLKYSDILLKKGRVLEKKTDKKQNGIIYKISMPPVLVKVPSQLSIEKIINQIENKKVVFTGENHPNFTHHLNQLKIIKGLYQKNKKMAIGMEMFQRKFQNVIDDYLNDKIDLKTFLKKSEYFKRWKFNFNLYRPIIDFAKQNRIPIIALNLEEEITKKVARGGIFSLSKKELKMLPENLNFEDKRYESDMKTLLGFQHHSKKKGKKLKNEYMFEAQILWDETMAQSAAGFLEKHPDFKMVVIVGNGHIENFYGIPDRLYRRINAPLSVIAQDITPLPKSADYVIFTANDIKVKEPLKLGVYLKNNKNLKVDKVLKNSIAKKLGIKKGDIITSINGQKVKELADLKLELYFLKKKDSLRVTVKRGGKKVSLKLSNLL